MAGRADESVKGGKKGNCEGLESGGGEESIFLEPPEGSECGGGLLKFLW